MKTHINDLVMKYFLESLYWDETYDIKPQTNYDYYINAEEFLKAKDVELLAKETLRRNGFI